ncbi:MAG: hypothetical protein ABWZ78_04065 [Burkholderiaceae bacterium]
MAAFYERALGSTRTDEGNLGSVRLILLSRDPTEHRQLVLATGRPADPTLNVVNRFRSR